jgi:hypothetical protein
MGKEEKRRLDNLMGMALLDERICKRLLNERDTSWLTSFGLSTETQSWLQTVEAQSLTELAQAIVARVQDDTIIISSQAA